MGDEVRRYRFAPVVRAGLWGALAPSLLVTVGAGLLAAGLTVALHAPTPLVLVPLAVAGVVAFGRWNGEALHTLAPSAVGWGWRRGRRRTAWLRPVPLTPTAPEADLPVVLQGLEVMRVYDGVGAGMGVVVDQRSGTVTGVLRVAARAPLALLEPAEQDTEVGLWGQALAGFCREGTPVVRVAWHHHSAPDSTGFPVDNGQPVGGSAAAASYRTLLADAAPAAMGHEVLVAVTVDQRHLRTRRTASRRREAGVAVAIEQLTVELGLFAERLRHARLDPGTPLSGVELVTAVRCWSDPAVTGQLDVLCRTLSAAAGYSPPEFGPMAATDGWAEVMVDGAVHRSWRVARWPRRDVLAGWLDPLLANLPAPATVTAVFEPVPPSQSNRDLEREAVTRHTNLTDRARHGFRIPATARHAAHHLDQREEELAAGYGECTYTGLITLTASTTHDLDKRAGPVEQVAGQAGIELRVLYGRQAAGWVASLPLGRTLTRPRR